MINLRLEEDGAYVEIFENGISKWRHITTKDLVQCLNQSIGQKIEEESVASPILPVGTIGYTAHLHEKDSYDLYFYLPGQKTTLLFEDRAFNNIGIPGAVYKFSVKNKQLMETVIWAVASTSKVRPEENLYHYPVYNVLDGRLCMGMNRVTINDPRELYKVPGMIQQMPGTHAYAARNKSGLERDSLYKALQGKDFPDEWLVPANITLGKFIK